MLESFFLALLLSFLIVSSIFLVILKRRAKAAIEKSSKSEHDLLQLQKKLQVTEYQLTEAQRTGAVGSFIWNLKDNVIVLSEELYRLYGKEPKNEKLSMVDFLSLVYPEDREGLQKRLSEASHSVEPFEHTYRVSYQDKIHWLKARIRTMHSDANMPLQVMGTVRDVSEVQEREEHLQAKTLELTQKVSELEQARATMTKLLKELSAERAKDGAILSSIGEGIVATDENEVIIFINPSAESLLGVRLIDVMGKSFEEIVVALDESGKSIPSEERPIRKTLHEGKVVSESNYYYQKSDKTKFPVYISVAPILLNGKTIGAINVFRDITREKDIDRMKTEFISLASHQLRTPLAAMKWFLEELLDGDVGVLTKEQAEIVGNVNESNERMIALVNSLLNVSRLESGRIIVDPEPTDLRQLINGVLVEVKPKLLEKKHEFSFSAPDDLPIIPLDPKLIRQVYMNLLTNAIKYTPEGGHISVTLSKKDADILSEVSDTGYGIPEKDAGKVFSKFYRGENITALETDGNGLGLYLVKSIIESSNGKIWYTSTERKGTTFSFTLPLSGMQAKEGEVVLT